MGALKSAVTTMLAMETEARQRCTEADILPPVASVSAPAAQQEMTTKIVTLTTRKPAPMSKEEEAKEEETTSIRDLNANGFVIAFPAELYPGTSVLMPPVDYAEAS